MEYKTGETPQVGDHVLGEISGEKVAGQVSGVRKDRIVVTRRGPANLSVGGGKTQFVKGQIEQVEGQAEDFELLYRKPGRKEAK